MRRTLCLLAIWSNEALANGSALFQIDVPAIRVASVLQCEGEDGTALLDGFLLLVLVCDERLLDDIEGFGGGDGVCLRRYVSQSLLYVMLPDA